MIWAVVALALLSALLFVGCVLLVLANQLWNSETQADMMRKQQEQVTDLMRTHKEVVDKIVDGPKSPGFMPLPEMASKQADEEWLDSKESLIQLGDDLSPVFDPEEI